MSLKVKLMKKEENLLNSKKKRAEEALLKFMASSFVASLKP